ncbi:MAG: type II toxin-antitoxin system RelE/ParE family toxin [Pirellulales bacterium]
MPRVIRTADSRDDLTAIWLYIAQDSVSAADRWIDKIDRVLQLLAASPGIGETVDHLRPGTRRFNVGSYQLFFEPLVDGIRLLRVYHASRRIEELFQD